MAPTDRHTQTRCSLLVGRSHAWRSTRNSSAHILRNRHSFAFKLTPYTLTAISVVMVPACIPVSSCRDDHSPDGSYRSPLSETECGPLSSLSCRLVVLTNKAATVCLICTTPVDTPSISSLLSPASAPSPSSSSSPLSSGSSSYRSERRDKTITDARSSPPSHHRMKTRHSAGGESHAGPGDWPPRVFLRRCCRFNHDLLRASIMRYARPCRTRTYVLRQLF